MFRIMVGKVKTRLDGARASGRANCRDEMCVWSTLPCLACRCPAGPDGCKGGETRVTRCWVACVGSMCGCISWGCALLQQVLFWRAEQSPEQSPEQHRFASDRGLYSTVQYRVLPCSWQW